MATVEVRPSVGDACAPPPLHYEGPWESLRQDARLVPCTVVIFGASGDLTRRKLVPALFHLHQQGLLPEGFALIGFARTEWTHAEFRAEMRQAVLDSKCCDVREEAWAAFSDRLRYISGDLDDPNCFRLLRDTIAEVKLATADTNVVYHLALPPKAFAPVVKGLRQVGLAEHNDAEAGEASPGFRRIIVEKPFGLDLDSSRALNDVLRAAFGEKAIYRIDHYLGKETVQNLMVFRFANGIFEPLWNRHYIDHVQITVAEDLGVEERAGYYDGVGVVRDMIQNHLLQLLSLVAMEPPTTFEAEEVRDQKVRALKAVIPPTNHDPANWQDVAHGVVLGQYGASATPGAARPYRQEPGVAPDSLTPTFAALRLEIDNWRWAGVPFYLRSGKHMAKKATEVVVQFLQVPHTVFAPTGKGRLEPNRLVFRIQPDEGISLHVAIKQPGLAMRPWPVDLDVGFGKVFEGPEPTAYETLLLDALLGDQTLFPRSDELEAAWKIVDPLLSPAGEPLTYPSGTWGPEAAERLLQRDERCWRL